MGTDQLGRDQMQRMMAAGRVSLAVGFVAMIIAIFLGTFIGILAGYFKRLDGPLMRLTDMFLALPLIPLLLVMVMLFRDRIAGDGAGDGGLHPDRLCHWRDKLDACRPHRAGRGAGAEGTRVCAGVAVHRGGAAPGDPAPHSAQRGLSRHGGGHAGGGGSHHHRKRAVLPGPWLSARLPDLGAAFVRGPGIHAALPRAGDLPGAGNLADGAVGELYRRWPARRLGPAHPGR